jgi:hypothetical protein
MSPIANYIQHLAIHPNKQPDQKEYEEKFGGTNSWYTDAVGLLYSKGIPVGQLRSNLEKAGVHLGENKKKTTAGMRRQYFLDCCRVGGVIDLQSC